MLTIIYGSDREKARKTFQETRDRFVAGGYRLEMVAEGSLNAALLEGMTFSRGLFGGKNLFVLEGLLEKKGDQELFVSWAHALSGGEHEILVYEPGAAKGFVSDLERAGAHAVECTQKAKDTRTFNVFSLSDLLVERKKKELWIAYQNALEAGISPEEISGTLFWSIKNMALVRTGERVASVSPFVLEKVKRALKHYTREEVSLLSQALIKTYHEGHRGGVPLEIGLEQFILNIL